MTYQSPDSRCFTSEGPNMTGTGQRLLEFMTKWSGKSGGLILVNELKKNGIKDVNAMTQQQKAGLLKSLTMDYLRTFLARTRFIVARAELMSVLGMDTSDYRMDEVGYRPPRSPDLIGKPRP